MLVWVGGPLSGVNFPAAGVPSNTESANPTTRSEQGPARFRTPRQAGRVAQRRSVRSRPVEDDAWRYRSRYGNVDAILIWMCNG